MSHLRPLEGCSVVDVSGYITGPFTSLQLADLGADVVKVEPPTGDPYRRFGVMREGVSMGFANVNRSRTGIVLDLTSADGRAQLLGRLATSDVLISNWRPGVAERLGLGDEVLWERNPRLIQAWITGYGMDGPLASAPTFDAHIQAQSGLAWVEGDGERPKLLQTFVADKVTAVMAAQAILAALVVRERTGKGTRLEVSMLDAVAYFNFPDMMATRTRLHDRTDHWSPSSLTLIRTLDGWITVAPSRGSQIKNACLACGHPEWIDEIGHLRDFQALAPELMRRIESVTRDGTAGEWVKRFLEHDVPAAQILDLDAHLANEQVEHNQIYGQLQDPRLGALRYARYPAVFQSEDGSRSTEPSVPPTPFPDVDRGGA